VICKKIFYNIQFFR